MNKHESSLHLDLDTFCSWEEEEETQMKIIHKDEDTVIIYEERSKATIFVDLQTVKVTNFVPGMAAAALTIEMYDVDLIQLKNDGIVIDQTFIGFDLVPLLAEGVPLKDIHTLGQLYISYI